MKKFRIMIQIPLLLLAVERLWPQSQEAVAVITELRLKSGDIQLKTPGGKSLVRPSVLQSLYPGTQIQVLGDASVVVLLTEEMKTITVEKENSPFEIKTQGKETQGTARLREIASLLFGKKKPATYVPLAVRGKVQPPTPLSPRNTNLMTDSPLLQWEGMERQSGTVRIYGPEGLLWSAENVAATQMRYPSSAPPLKPGVEYSWVIERRGLPAEKVRFRLLAADAVQRVQDKIAALDAAVDLSKITLAILKANLLVSQELFYEAREILLEATKSDPDEPTLHFLLGEVYERSGLKKLAQNEYAEAEFLAKNRP